MKTFRALPAAALLLTFTPVSYAAQGHDGPAAFESAAILLIGASLLVVARALRRKVAPPQRKEAAAHRPGGSRAA